MNPATSKVEPLVKRGLYLIRSRVPGSACEYLKLNKKYRFTVIKETGFNACSIFNF